VSAASLALPSAAVARDVAAGEKAFLKCEICHQIGENAKSSVGPILNAVVGRDAGTVESYNYSPANKNSGYLYLDQP
jgi:cytochrome c